MLVECPVGTAGKLGVWATARKEPELAVSRPVSTFQSEKLCPVNLEFGG